MLVAPNSLPPIVDLRPGCSPVENQGPIGSCSGHAFSGALEYLENTQGAFNPQKGSYFEVSRLFTYYNERILENSTGQDAGAFIHDGIKALSTYGICQELVWPYDVTKVTQKPHDAAYADAATRKISKFAQVINTDPLQVKQTLASGFPIVCGLQLYESFEGPQVAHTGQVQMPKPGEKCVGGHAVLMVGYNDTVQRFLFRNSWGPEWGIGGYFSVPYAYVTNMRLTSDAWVINK
jgi:C1A family cysteine protease